MKTFLVAGGLLVLAAAGCSSSDSDTPDPGALASSIKAQATAPAGSPADSSASASGEDPSGDCGSAPLSAKAALAGMSVTDVSMVEGCTNILVKTPVTDPAIGKDMCDKVAGEVYQMGVKTIAVESDAGDPLAVGSQATGCQTP